MRKLILFMLLISASNSFAQNTAYGTNAGNSGNQNASFGEAAGDVVTGTGNAFMGYNSGKLTTSGGFNAFFGSFSGSANTTGTSNTFLGYGTGYGSTTGTGNTFIGRSVGFVNTTGNYNVYVGFSSGRFNTTGYQNLGLGDNAGTNITTGNSNVLMGTNSGYTLTTGVGNVFIGANSGYSETGSNKLYIDNSNTSTPLIYGDFSTNQVGINALPSGYTLNVGGPINATGVFVNGVAVGGGGGSSQWSNNAGSTPTTIFYNGGNVGIGNFTTATTGSFKLAVDGKIGAREVQVTVTNPWPDYVFEPSYKTLSLTELELFIKTNKHLPEIPSASEVKENGHGLGEMDVLLLKKVEELTLYLIELKKEVETIKIENEKLKSELNKD